jgi:hypothetical protein
MASFVICTFTKYDGGEYVEEDGTHGVWRRRMFNDIIKATGLKGIMAWNELS